LLSIVSDRDRDVDARKYAASSSGKALMTLTRAS
jgi:hypothetical protein